MRQVVFAYVLIQGWTINSYVHGFFNQPGEILSLPTNKNKNLLNKNIGKYHLPHMWDEVLNNSRELKLK